MTRRLTVAVLALVSVIFTACGGGAPAPQSTQAAAPAAAAAGSAATAAPNEKWPTSAITVVVPTGPGASIDNLARVLQPHFSKELGVPVVIDNQAGGAYTVGVNAVWKKPADGQSIFFFSDLYFTTARLLIPDTMPNGVDDVAFLGGLIAPDEAALMVKPGGKYQDLRSVLQALQRGEKVTLGTVAGDPAIYGMLALCDGLGIRRPELVFYTDGGKERIDLLGGQLDLGSANHFGFVSLHKAGQATFIGLFADARATDIAEVPTVREVVEKLVPGKGSVVPSLAITRFMAVPAKVKTDRPSRYQFLSAAVKRLVQDNADFKAAAEKAGFVPRWTEPDVLAKDARLQEVLVKKYPEATGK